VKLFSQVDRLVIREVVPPTILGFITYTFLVLMRGLYSLLEQVLVRGVSLADAGRVLLITIPHVVVLTIPMAFLFGVLLGIGRMNTDNELVALQAGGIPVRRLLQPIVILGLLLTALNGHLYLNVIPGSGRDLRDLKVKLFASAKNLGRIEPGVFHEEIPNVLLYVKEVDNETGEWRDILFFDNSSPGEERLTLARRGQMVTAGLPAMVDANLASGELPEMEQWIRLEDVVTHQFMRVEPETYRVNRNRSQLIRPNTAGQGKVSYHLGIGERETGELVSLLQGGEFDGVDTKRESEEDRETRRRLASIELNKRLAIPFACTVFALLALPLGVGARSGGRSRGFVVSVAVVLTYYLVSNQGEMLAIEGRIPPWMGIWLPNIVLTIAAFALMRRMGRWMGERESGDSLVRRGVNWLHSWWENLKQRRHWGAATTPISGSIPVNVQRRRYATRFPALFDRYITRRLLPPLLLVLGSSAMLYIVIDLSDRVEDMAKNNAPADVILAYYANLVPQVFLDVTPMALLIAVLILLTVLERQHELTALKAAGISLFRLVIPILLIAAVSAAGLWVLGEIVVPDANREAKRLRDRIMGHETTRTYRSSDRQWLMSRDDETLYNFLRYDSPSETLIRFTVFRIDDEVSPDLPGRQRRVQTNHQPHEAQHSRRPGVLRAGVPNAIGNDDSRAQRLHPRAHRFRVPPQQPHRPLASEAHLSPFCIRHGLVGSSFWPQPRRPHGEYDAGGCHRPGTGNRLHHVGDVVRKVGRGGNSSSHCRCMGPVRSRPALRDQPPDRPQNLTPQRILSSQFLIFNYRPSPLSTWDRVAIKN